MSSTDGGRYYVEELNLEDVVDTRGQLQEALAAGEGKDWHLVGVCDLPGSRVILFWDTIRPSYGRSQYSD